METARAPQPPLGGQPGWGQGRQGPSPSPAIRPPGPGLPGARGPLAGSHGDCLQPPQPPARRGAWRRQRRLAAGDLAAAASPPPSAPPGLGRRGLISLPRAAPLLPGMPRSREPPGAPRPDFAIGGGPALGAAGARPAAEPQVGAPAAPSCGIGAPGRRAGWGDRDRGAAWGWGARPAASRGHGAGDLEKVGAARPVAPRGARPGVGVPPSLRGVGVAGRREGGRGSGLFYPREFRTQQQERDREKETDRHWALPKLHKGREKLPKHRGECIERNTHKETPDRCPRNTAGTREAHAHSQKHTQTYRQRGTKRAVLQAVGRGRGKEIRRRGETEGGGNVAGMEKKLERGVERQRNERREDSTLGGTV